MSDPTPSPLMQQLTGLGTLLTLEKKARHAGDEKTLAFVMVNETLQLLRYDQALLFQISREGDVEPLSVSGVDRPATDAPYVSWTTRLARHLLGRPDGNPILDLQELPVELQSGWKEWNPGHLLWMPLRQHPGSPMGGILLRRGKDPWQSGEATLLDMLTDAYAHAWESLRRRERDGGIPVGISGLRRWRGWGLVVVMGGILAWPVPLSVLAPAQVVPHRPLIISAPLDGVIHTMEVQPNQSVRKGDPLFSLEETTLRNRLEVARKAREVSLAQLRRGNQQAFGDDRSRGELMLLQAQVEEKEIEVAYTEEQLARSRVLAPKDGIVFFSGPNNWLGKPVVTGEKVMTLSDPKESDLEILLPVSDAIALEVDSPVALFLNASPGEPVHARLKEIGYQAGMQPDGLLAYPLRAEFSPGSPPPRLGLRGIAKLQHGRVSLLYYLFRRPLAALRQTTGW